jgi:prepilin-type N-terminal cleavage/methylation domain-containing protein/prepilin-type processing-associated H-X9-DG protein
MVRNNIPDGGHAMLARKTGFTLIELLVVIAIIAILAAILFPVFAKARSKAHQATCSSNLRQITTAILMYTDDYDETFPAITRMCSSSNPDAYRPIQLRIQPYVKNWQVFNCASAIDIMCDGGSIGYYAVDPGIAAGWFPSTFRLSYGFADPMETIAAQRDVASWKRPTQLVVVADAAQPICHNWYRIAYANTCAAGCTASKRTPDNTRHNGGSNLGFADGHVKWMQAQAIVGAGTNPGRSIFTCPSVQPD